MGQILLENLDSDTVFQLLDIFSSDGPERRKCLEFIETNLKEMRARPDWKEETRRQPQILVDLQELIF